MKDQAEKLRKIISSLEVNTNVREKLVKLEY